MATGRLQDGAGDVCTGGGGKLMVDGEIAGSRQAKWCWAMQLVRSDYFYFDGLLCVVLLLGCVASCTVAGGHCWPVRNLECCGRENKKQVNHG
jgi:hypothetical protein